MLVFVLPLPLNSAVSPLTGTPVFQLPSVVQFLSGAARPVHDRVFWAREGAAAREETIMTTNNRRKADDIGSDISIRYRSINSLSTMLNVAHYSVNKITEIAGFGPRVGRSMPRTIAQFHDKMAIVVRPSAKAPAARLRRRNLKPPSPESGPNGISSSRY